MQSEKIIVDLAGLPTALIDSENIDVSGKSQDIKLKKLNELYSAQELRKIDFCNQKEQKQSSKKDVKTITKDILKEHNFKKIDKKTQVSQDGSQTKHPESIQVQKSELNNKKISKPLRTEENYNAKMEQFKNQQNDKKENKNYWDYFKEFSKENIVFQEIKTDNAPIYIPTNKDKNDPYFQKIFKNLDLTCLIQNDAFYRNNYTQLYENQLTEEKFIRQYQITRAQKTVDDNKEVYMINVQFYEFKEEKYLFELNKDYKILLDIQEREQSCPQFLLLNQGANFYYFKKFEDEKIKEFQLHEINLSKADIQTNDENEYQRIIPLKQYNITLPEDLNCDFMDLEYQFMVDATPGSEENFRLNQKDLLRKQYILIQTYKKGQIILIYSLKDTSKPIIRFENEEFQKILFGFYTYDDGYTYLTLKSYGFTYQIKHSEGDQTIQREKVEQKVQENQIEIKNEKQDQEKKFKLEDFPNIKLLEKRNSDFGLKNIYPVTLNVTLDDDKDDSFLQTFYISDYYYFDLIYPMQPCEKNDDKRQKVIDFIEKKYGTEGRRLNHIFFNNQPNFSTRQSEISLYLDQEHKISNYQYWDNVILKKDIIFLNDGTYYRCLILIMKKQLKSYSSLEKIKNEYKDSSNFSLFNKILSTFDWKSNRMLQQKKINQNDENFESFYINKIRENVFTTHNSACISDQYFYFQDNYLLIDLSEKDQLDGFKLLKLYENKVNDQVEKQIKKLRLVKYHRSEKCVIFFFFYKCNFYIKEGAEQISDQEFFGVHFFVFRSVDQLKQMILSDEALIKDECVIYVPLEINNFIKEKYNSKNLLNYVGQDKKQLQSSTYINFELVRDFGDPCQDWLPFYYQNWVRKGLFESYICFFNVEMLSEKTKYQMQNELEDQINFKDFLQIFKIDFYKGINEKSQQTYKTVKGSVISLRQEYAKMFQRCSNWQKNVFGNTGEQFSAKFYIGEVLKNDQVLNVELREYFVTIDKNKKTFFNKELQIFENTKHKQDFASNINIVMSKLKPNLFSNSLKSQYGDEIPTQNFELVPKIKTNGDIDGCYLILQKFVSNGQILQITEKESVIKEHDPELFNELKHRLKQYVFVDSINEENQKFNARFLDGEKIDNLNIQILNSDYYASNSKNEGQQNVKTFFEAVCQEQQKVDRPSRIVYDVLNIESKFQNKTKYHYLKSKIFSMNYRNVYFNPKNSEQYISQLEIILNKKCILKKYFDKDESTQQFYYIQKYLISASLPNMFDLLFENNNNYKLQFFQPRFILNGQSLCSLAFDSSQVQFDVFKKALEYELKDTETDQFLSNSILYHSAKKHTQETLQNFVPESIIKQYNMNHLFGLMKDFLKYETIVQAALKNTQNNRLKEASFLIGFILSSPDVDGLNWYSLMQDIPQILCSKKFNINQFFNVSAIEEQAIFEPTDEIKEENINVCNFERSLNNPDLPQFGNETKNIIFMQNFNETFFNDEEIQNQIILVDKNKEKEKDLSKIQVQVEHSFIAFDPIIKKIKIDKILKRVSDKNINTDYLDLFDKDPKNIKYMNDLVLSNLIFRNIDTPQFLEQNTVQLMIEIQYKESKPFIKNLLIVYTLGFYIPYIYASFQINYNDNMEQRSKFELYLIYFLYLLAFITQTTFMVFELAEIRYNGVKEYFSDSWNYFDSSQYFIFLGNSYLSLIQMNLPALGYYKLLNQVLKIVILLMATTKILQYIRYKDSFSFLVQMLTAVLIDLFPFLTIFMLYIFVFSMIIIIMEADISADDYQGIPRIMRIMIGTFRNSIGDISIIQYGKWGDDDTQTKDSDHEGAKYYAQFIIWTFWFFNLFFMLIIMLNFLIAEVSQTYDKVKSQGLISIYRQKAALNKLVFQIKHIFHQNKEFRVMTIEKPPENSESEEFQEFSTFSERIKRNTNEQITKLKSNINKINKQQIEYCVRIEKTTKNVESLVQKSQISQQANIKAENQQPVGKNFENEITTIKTQMNELQVQVQEILKNQKTEIETQKIVVGSILELMKKQVQDGEVDNHSEIDSQNK